MTMMMFRKPSNTAPCARKWSLAPTTPSETRSSVKRTTWWVSHICFLFFDHHDNMVSFSYMFLCSMILCDNHRHHDAPSRRTWRNVESVEPRSKARRFGQLEAFTMLNASNVKSASKTIIFKNKRRHLWKSICLFTVSPQSQQTWTQVQFMRHDILNRWSEQALLSTGEQTTIIIFIIIFTSISTLLITINIQDYTKRFAAHCSVCKSAIVPKEGQTKVWWWLWLWSWWSRICWHGKISCLTIVSSWWHYLMTSMAMMTLLFSPRPPGSMLWTRISIRIASSVRWSLPSSVINKIINQNYIHWKWLQ